MISFRYSEMEMQQWHDATATAAFGPGDAPRTKHAPAMMAKGQADSKPSRSTDAMTQPAQPKHDPWASECLFDWYNS